MDAKTLAILEYPKILERLAGYCAFAASAERARSLRPTNNLLEAQHALAETSEAVALLNVRPELTIGGARDIRAAVDLAAHGGVLTPPELLDIKSTLIAARELARIFEKHKALCPTLSDLAAGLPTPQGLVDAITRAISERGDILDTASPRLGEIRREQRIAHERLLSRLQRIISDPKNGPLLQEALITQRDGRYVIPLRAEFKGQMKSIVHDQSSSGATLFVEPLAVVEANNQHRQLLLAERDEERRILAELSGQVGLMAGALNGAVEIIAVLDLALAKARYAEALRATAPELVEMPLRPLAENRHPGVVIQFIQARHPLLSPDKVVPIDVELDPRTYALIVTGPNTGGKTVTLKTTGLLALMAQSGMHIPAHSGGRISLFDSIYADIGDEQSIEQSLSTFSGHITNIIHILAQADRRSLVILDELGAGTDPQEGAALARAILSHLLERGITTLVTTHHPELKAFAHATPGVVNASVEFDLETLRPTYHLTIGLPGRSNALAIAQRLGMPLEIIQMARSELNPTDVRAEDLLDEIHRQRDLSRQARSAAEHARREVESLRAELSQRLTQIENERLHVLEQARRQAEAETADLQAELRQARRLLTRARQPLADLQAAEAQVQAVENKVEKAPQRSGPDPLQLERPLKVGDKVRLMTLNMQGVLTSIDGEGAEVQVGALRLRSRLAELLPASAPLPTPDEPPVKRKVQKAIDAAQPVSSAPLYHPSPGVELDLRGQRADDALMALDRHLESAYLAGLPYIRIIHGKGSGKLRIAVRDLLKQHTHVLSFESGGEKEGGDGVTVAKLR